MCVGYLKPTQHAPICTIIESFHLLRPLAGAAIRPTKAFRVGGLRATGLDLCARNRCRGVENLDPYSGCQTDMPNFAENRDSHVAITITETDKLNALSKDLIRLLAKQAALDDAHKHGTKGEGVVQ